MTILEKALRWAVLAGIFALPFIAFVVTTSLFFPYITGKNFAFRILVELITGAWLALALVYPAYRCKRSWVLGAIALFVFVIAIADAQGVYPFKSFWSNYERMDGWVTLIHVLLLTVVASVMLDSEKLWRRFWQTSLAASVALSLYGFLQIAGALSLDQSGGSGWMARIDATFGNPIYLAVYMLFHVFLAAWLWVRSRTEASVSSRKLLAWWYGFVIVVDSLAVLFSGTRGTMLGLVGGGILALLAYSFTSSASHRVRQWAIGSMLAVVVFGSGLWLARDTAFVRSVGFLDRLASISLQDNTTKARLMNMGMAWEGFKERPLLGWGQENYAIVFDKYYNPQMYAQEPWFDRVHNIIFDWLVAGGIIGLLAYLSIFAAVLRVLWKKENGFGDGEKAIFTGLLGGYFIHNFFVFDNITSYILFAFVLAYVVWRSTTATKAAPVFARTIFPKSALPFTAVVGVLVAVSGVWYVNANALSANIALLNALRPQSSGVLANLAYYQQSIAYGTYGMQEAREQLSQAATQIASVSTIDTAAKQKFYDAAVSQMKLQEAMSPLDARFPLFLGIVESVYGNTAQAQADLEKAHELSPDKQSILFQLAANQMDQGDAQGALATLKQAYELAPEFAGARILYAVQLIQTGDEAQADQLIAPLIPTGEAADPRLAAAYAKKNEYNKIVTIWEAHLKVDPTDIQSYFTLAAAYTGAGESAKAIAVLQAVETIAPQAASQAETYIQEIKNGTATVK